MNKTTNFQNFITLQRGFDLPKSKMKEGNIPVLGSSSTIGYHNEAKIGPPGVVTGRSGTLGFVQFIDKPYWPHNTALWVKDFKGNYPLYVYYKLKTLNLERFNGGASVPTLNRNVLNTLEIEIPDITTQQKIASILSAYDDLIENNRRRIALLEEAARLLYREWFVHFRFPGHEHTRFIDGLPEGWERVKLGDTGYLNYGKALKADTRVPGPYPVFGSSGVVGTHNKALVEGPGIIVGRKGNVGSVYYSEQSFYPIDTVYFINRGQTDYYLYNALKNISFINTDVAVPGLNRDYAHSRELVEPSKVIKNEFIIQVTPIYKQIFGLKRYIEQLKQTRDLLIPRLMNGELAV